MENLVLVPLPTPCTTTVIDGVTYVFMDPAVLRFALAAPSPAQAAGVTVTDEMIWAAHDKIWDKRTAMQFSAVKEAVEAAFSAQDREE